MTPQEKRIRAAQLESEALKLRAEAEQESQQHEPVSPRTKLPVSDPESQAVERIHAEMQTSIFEHPDAQKSSE
jgi:hypothetical protein